MAKAAETDARVGTEVAGYRIESVLGRGGMSTVYLAEHHGLQRKVALKVLDQRLAQDERFRERFVRESRLAASLEDPNVIPIYEAGEADGVLFIAMRRVEGTDLKALLEREGALPPARTVSIVSQVANALDAAHAKGLVHRDVKPGNVLIVPPPEPTRREHVYLSDFGLTKRASSDSGITGTGQFVGTLDYAAPEQFEGKPLDARTDVYSLGCVLYECLTGEVPFRKEQDAALMYAHLNESPPKPTDLRPELPPAIDQVVATAMAKKPEDRFPTAGALAEAAQRALGEGRAIAPPAPGPGEGEARPARRPRRRRAFVAAGVAACVAVAAVAAFLLTRGGGSPRPSAGPPPAFSVIALDPATGRIVRTIPHVLTGTTQCQSQLPCVYPMEAGEGGVWLASGSTFIRVDERSGLVTRVAGAPSFTPSESSVAVGFPTVWVAAGKLLRFDPSTGQALKPVKLPSSRDVLAGGLGGNAIGVALGQGSAWAFSDDGYLTRIDVQTGRIQRRLLLYGMPESIVDGAGGLWWGNFHDGIVLRMDPNKPSTTTVTAIQVGQGVGGIAAGMGRLWVLNRAAGTVTSIDPTSNQLSRPVRVGPDPVSIAVGLGKVWVADQRQDAVYRIDPATGSVKVVPIGAPVAGIAVDESQGRLWLEVIPKG